MHPKCLLVEDHDQKGAVIHVMKRYVRWPTEPASWPVEVMPMHSAGEVLEKSFLTTKFKSSGLKSLGLIVDADTSAPGRWQQIAAILSELALKCPSTCPKEGLVVQNSKGKKFGSWIMPDNESSGMVEDFCHRMIPSDKTELWEYAQNTAVTARDNGAPWKDAHKSKATIHTWLAWQDPPGERMGTAITKRILDSNAPIAKSFADWMIKLFDMERK